MKKLDHLIEKAKSTIQEIGTAPIIKDYGQVLEVKDGVAIISGLSNVGYGEVVEFQNQVKGYVIDIDEERNGTIILGDYLGIKGGDLVFRLGYTLSVPVSKEMIGRVVNSLGHPVDGLENFTQTTNYPVEKIAPGVIKRKSVDVPLQTGIKVIDALVPIGRGQRELIIGDRGIGKTTLAVDTIINQKGQNVICIYCAIGQRNSKIASVIETIRENGAMNHTIVVSASASEPVSLQYLAPYTATAIGEYFMDQGKDVLIVYDDLTKHAWAYRQLSLILRRPAGREAYPGDVFYLHSRLLERACRLDEKYGGGSITALPIVETLEGDISTYIPTNVISITDGQIFLETDLFNSGIRPAVNIGLSVSRVGGAAQTKAMKKVAGKLKLDLAQYREMAAFSQFESELDEQTRQFLNRGARLTQILVQDKNQPLSLAHQVAIIYAAANGYLDKIEVTKVKESEERILSYLNQKGRRWLERVNKKNVIEEEDEVELKKLINEAL
ncbi:MAG: F0F1 ATP synthase subunit alpha [Patescibacteria group bacterium]|nr:F0F1 ATP synthase subunit alpha [Patescibacteria group bacterium]